MAKRGFRRRSCIDCWRRKVSCDVGQRRRDGHQACSACTRRNRPCRMNVSEHIYNLEDASRTEQGSDARVSPNTPPDNTLDLLSALSAPTIGDVDLVTLDPSLSSSPSYDVFTPVFSEFLRQPWLVSRLLATHAQEVEDGTMPLLKMGGSICYLLKSGTFGTDQAQLLIDARLSLESATTRRESTDYDILTSMVALSEVWNIAEGLSTINNNLVVDVRSLQAMCKLIESCLAKPMQDKDNAYLFWTIYVYDAFEAIDMERLPYLQEPVVEVLRRRFALRKQTPQEEWFAQLCSLASIARTIASASWTARTVPSINTLDVRRQLYQQLQDWTPPRAYLTPRDDLLSLLHMACFVYLHVILSKSFGEQSLDAILLHRDVESGALRAMLTVFKLLDKVRNAPAPRPSLLDQSRTAVHLVITFAYWALEHVESHIGARHKSEQEGLAQGASGLLDAILDLFAIDTDASIHARYHGARQLHLHVQSLLQLLGTADGFVNFNVPAEAL